MKRKFSSLFLALGLSLALAAPAAAAQTAPGTDLGWVAAYQETVNALARENPDLTYDLIYVDADQIPELAADLPGYFTYLFTYSQGKLQTLMDGWGYGAMGNTGYEYLPYGNSIFNHNSDFAGALSYETYLRIGPDGELEDCYDEPLTVWHFEDWNGNDFPDDGEYLDTPRYRYGDRVLTQAEYDSFGSPGEYLFIEGTMSKDEILETLRAYTPQPEVPAAAPGAKLPGYYGDQAKCRMTAEQAQRIRAKIEEYTAAPSTVESPVSKTDVYATLFDAGAGIPGLLLAKGYCAPSLTGMSGPLYYDETVIYDFGEAEIWSFQNGALVPFAAPGDRFTIYPTCVKCENGSPDGSYWEAWHYPLSNGSIASTPAAVLISEVMDDNFEHIKYTLNGAEITEAQYDQNMEMWRTGDDWGVSAAPGGGVEYVIQSMTPADEVAAALNAYQGPTAPAMAVASTQTVSVDGKAVEFQMYALKNEAGNLTNYVKVRDLANVLNGTAAQFEVGYYGMVNIAPGWAYTPNGSEMKTPFSGDRAYTKSASQTNVGGELMDLDAIVLTDDAGGGYTYYQLRDLGKALGFNVGWSKEKGVFIETDKAYDPAD